MDKTKVCSRCGAEYPATTDYFHIRKDRKSGLRSNCKFCIRKSQNNYTNCNKEKRVQSGKKYRENHRNKVLIYQKEYYLKHKERKAQYYQDNKLRVLQYEKKRRAIDPKYNLDRNMCSSISCSLQGHKKGRRWQNLVGYTVEQLMVHLESQFKPGMSWDNYGLWHVDHIKPKSLFSYNTPEDPEFRECWALNNLQPLWAKDNLKKSNTWHS